MTKTQHVPTTKHAHACRRPALPALRPQPRIEVLNDDRRIGALHDPVVDAAVDEIRDEDGGAESGMVITVRYDDTGEIETFLLAAEHEAIEVHSIDSPLGRAIAGARPGERRTYSIPNAIDRHVTLLRAMPYGRQSAKHFGAHDDRPHHSRSHRGIDTSRYRKVYPFWTTAMCTAI